MIDFSKRPGRGLVRPLKLAKALRKKVGLGGAWWGSMRVQVRWFRVKEALEQEGKSSISTISIRLETIYDLLRNLTSQYAA